MSAMCQLYVHIKLALVSIFPTEANTDGAGPICIRTSSKLEREIKSKYQQFYVIRIYRRRNGRKTVKVLLEPERVIFGMTCVVGYRNSNGRRRLVGLTFILGYV